MAETCCTRSGSDALRPSIDPGLRAHRGCNRLLVAVFIFLSSLRPCNPQPRSDLETLAKNPRQRTYNSAFNPRDWNHLDWDPHAKGERVLTRLFLNSPPRRRKNERSFWLIKFGDQCRVSRNWRRISHEIISRRQFAWRFRVREAVQCLFLCIRSWVHFSSAHVGPWPFTRWTLPAEISTGSSFSQIAKVTSLSLLLNLYLFRPANCHELFFGSQGSFMIIHPTCDYTRTCWNWTIVCAAVIWLLAPSNVLFDRFLRLNYLCDL